jgi:tetratricopeptide (TPR) repeat protein
LQRNIVKGASVERVERCQFGIRDQLGCRFWGIFWIDASSKDNIERGLVKTAAVCGVAGEVNVFRRWLSNLSETWLMIFDNADDPDLDLSRYFPVGARGTTLITTRNPECRHHAPTGSSWELREMAVEEAIVLILKMSGVDDVSDPRMRDMAKPVVLTLGCLALAVAQAGAVIQQGVCGMDEYCELYSQRRKELLGHRSVQGGDGYKYTVYTTWEISLQAIEAMADVAAKNAMELLQIFSFLHHEGISEEIFRRAWTNLWNEDHSDWIKRHQFHILLRQGSTEWEPQALRKALSILSSFSLINRDKNGLMSMHPLVHGWARDRLSRSDEEWKWTLTVSTIAVSISWTFQTADYRFRRSLIPHLDACLRVYGGGIFRLQTTKNDNLGMAEKFALAYQENGRYVEASELTEKVMVARKRTLGEDHPDTLRAMHALANLNSEVGRQQEALELMEKVVAKTERTLGEEHLDTLRAMHNLAISYSEVGRRREALELTEKVVAARERMLGEEHPDMLGSMHTLANRYSEVGRRQEALELMEKVVAARKKMLGEEHPDTLRSMYTLANRYSEVGRRQEALELTEKVVTTRERTLGEEHPDTLRSIHALAINYSEVGRQVEALELTEKVVTASERTLGEEHPETLGATNNLANCYSEVGRQQEALELIEKVVAAKKRTLGEEHPNTLGSIHNLANCYNEVGRRQEALELMEKVVTVRKRTLGEEHPDTLQSYRNLTIFEKIPGPSAESPGSIQIPRKASNYTTDNLKGRQKASTRRFRRKLI